METFNYPYHKTSTRNPESSGRIQFGNSYVFTSEPVAPDQRVFRLDFAGMKYYLDEHDAVEATTNSQFNMKSLIDFYGRHKLHKSFLYNHPVHGLKEVRFNIPLEEPTAREGGSGVTEAFTVELIEVVT